MSNRELGILLSLMLGWTHCATTTPTPSLTPREERMQEYLRCFAEEKAIRAPGLLLFGEPRWVCQESSPGLKECSFVACQAIIQSGNVRCWRAWVNGETEYLADDSELAWAAAHEVCHLALKTSDEREAGECGKRLVESGVCR